VCVLVIDSLLPFGLRFQLVLEFVEKRQSVPSAMICCGVALIMPISRKRSA
jgi:hypothetical protein